MKCPLCNVEGRIDSVSQVTNGGKFYNKITIKCRNKECPNYNKIFHTQYDEFPVAEDSDAPT